MEGNCCVSGYSSFERYLSWYYFEPEHAQVFYRATNLLESEVQVLLNALHERIWIEFGGPDGDQPLSLIIEPSIDVDPARYLICLKEYDEQIEDLPNRGTRETQILFDEAWSLNEKILELRKFKRVGHFLRADCGGGPETFGYVETLTGEQFDAVADIMAQECHDLRCIFHSVSEFDRIGNETLWLQCAYEHDVYGAENHRDLWDIAQALISKTSSQGVVTEPLVSRIPTFDGQRLTIDKNEICKVTRKALNQHLILSTLQELGWLEHIDDPLPGGADGQRLRETIRELNKRQSKIQFQADGSGKGLVWELRG